MTYYPVAPAAPCWALFDAQGLQVAWTGLQGDSRTPEQLEAEAFRTINANRDDPAVYIVQCLWTEEQDHTTFYEQSDRVYAPMGEDPDRVPG